MLVISSFPNFSTVLTWVIILPLTQKKMANKPSLHKPNKIQTIKTPFSNESQLSVSFWLVYRILRKVQCLAEIDLPMVIILHSTSVGKTGIAATNATNLDIQYLSQRFIVSLRANIVDRLNGKVINLMPRNRLLSRKHGRPHGVAYCLSVIVMKII